MEQLLEIRTIPMNMELNIQPAKLEISTEQPSCQITRQKGSLEIDHTYPKLHIDTIDMRRSMGQMGPREACKQRAADSMKVAFDATVEIAKKGNAMERIERNTSIGQIARGFYMQRVQQSMESTIGAVPEVPPEIDWDPGELSMRYEADRLRFDWQTHGRANIEFTPAKIECVIKQYPRVEITFVGDPLYVPPSANPEYVAENEEVSA